MRFITYNEYLLISFVQFVSIKTIFSSMILVLITYIIIVERFNQSATKFK